MGTTCSICSHTKRLEIDRELVKGVPVAHVAQNFAVDYHALYRHAKNHVTRQLTQAWHKKELEHDFDLLNTVDGILTKTEVIFERNFKAKKDGLALKALDSQRNTIQLLANISYSLHQTKLTELEIMKLKSGEVHAEYSAKVMEGLQALNIPELKMYQRLINKIINRTDEVIIEAEPISTQITTPAKQSSVNTHASSRNVGETHETAEMKADTDDVYNSLRVQPVEPERIPVTKRRRRRKEV